MSSAADAIISGRDKDRSALLGLGSQLDKAQDEFNAVVSDKNSNPGQIEAAKQKFEQIAERFKAKVGIMDVVNRIINEIIQRIGQAGR